MEPLNYSFPFVRHVHVKIKILINQNGGIAKFEAGLLLEKRAHDR